MSRRTIASLSYGISTPEELFEKLKSDGDLLQERPHPHCIFNFIITCAVLNEWIRKAYKDGAGVGDFIEAMNKSDWQLLPEMTNEWLLDRPRILKTGRDARYHVLNVLQITWHTANASKHFHWMSSSGVSDIQTEPIVRNATQYYFSSRRPDLYVEYDGQSYGLSEIRLLLVQFFGGFLHQIGQARDGSEFGKLPPAADT